MLRDDLESVRLTALDRCDGCGAQAYSVAEHPTASSELKLCIHHRKEHYDRLQATGWTVIDDLVALGDLADNEKLVYS